MIDKILKQSPHLWRLYDISDEVFVFTNLYWTRVQLDDRSELHWILCLQSKAQVASLAAALVANLINHFLIPVFGFEGKFTWEFALREGERTSNRHFFFMSRPTHYALDLNTVMYSDLILDKWLHCLNWNAFEMSCKVLYDISTNWGPTWFDSQTDTLSLFTSQMQMKWQISMSVSKDDFQSN